MKQQQQGQQQQPRQRVKITHTNTDHVCLQQVHNPVSRFFYHVSLSNGFYMLEPAERRIFYALGSMVFAAAALYCYVFARGFFDGLLLSATTTTSTAAVATTSLNTMSTVVASTVSSSSLDLVETFQQSISSLPVAEVVAEAATTLGEDVASTAASAILSAGEL